jgi:hypothetical protein
MTRIIIAGLCILGAIASGTATVAALSSSFHYKWPYRWNTSAAITTLPFQGFHGCYPNGAPAYECVAAYDLVVASGSVAAANEGTAFVQGGFLPGECRSDGHYGNFVDIDGVRYGHLDAFAGGVATGANLLQGDEVGVQGSTGNVLPCPGGVHLHWEFLGASSVPVINGGSSTSTNSAIGEYSASGATLRTYYRTHGSWNGIGWTYEHCPGTCTLDMTANKTWGRMQDFQHDPDGFGGTFDTIHVATWDQTHAYLVDSVFWQAWSAGGQDQNGVVHPIGMAKAERGACPPGSSAECLFYQPFHLGFVWMDSYTGRHAVFCPDLNGDRIVDLTDLTIEAGQYLEQPAPPAVEVDGEDDLVDMTDLTIMAGEYLHDCHV